MSELVHRVRPAAGEPRGAIVLFHGRGADEYDLGPLLDALDPERQLAGVFPRGPLSLPPGGAHWYVVPRVGYPDPESFDASYASAGELVDGLGEQIGVPIERTVLAGFSQGAVMSFALGLGRGRPSPAGIMALSGFIPTVPGFEPDISGRAGLPVALAHGTYDPVIPVEFGHIARAALVAGGADLLYRESPVPHTIDPQVIPDLRGWLAQVL